MESGSDTEEFYDAAEELSPVKRRSSTNKEKEKNITELQESNAVDGKGKGRHEDPESRSDRKEVEPSAVPSGENKMLEVDMESLPECSVAAIPKEKEDNSPEQNLKRGKDAATEKPKEAIEGLKDTMDGTKTEKEGAKEKDFAESPAPVAPPRRKRRQKKDSTSKETDLPGKSETTEKQKPPPRPPAPHETESSSRPPSLAGPPAEQPPKNTSAKPPRPPRPPSLRPQTSSDSAPDRPMEQPLEPRVRMNTDSRDMTQDMTRVLERGSSLDIVYNTDSAETKGTDSGEREKERLPERDPPSLPSNSNLVRSNSISGRPLSDIEILQQVEVKNLDTGETIPLSVAEEKLPQCTNPMALHLMRLTSEYSSNPSLSQVVEDGHLSDSSTTPSVKVENKRKKLKRFFGKTVQKIRSVADEVKSRRGEESSSSDDEEAQENTYIKFKSHRAVRDRIAFDKIRLLQDLGGEHMGAVWTMKFSTCGRLLATAGQDNIVRIWVLKDAQPYFEDMRAKYSKTERSPSPTSSIASIASATSGEDDQSAEGSAETREDDTEDLGPFRRAPFCSYHGHTSDVLDLSWSKNYFILSSSMDKTVRLWHISRHECLCCFQHVDFVTAICFHPRDDRYFLSGSLDGKIRLWNIPEKKVALWNEIDGSRTSLITAANFCQNGKLAVVGTYDGRCIFYDTERLKYHTQLTVRSTRGKNARGRKISGIEPLPGEDKVLVTSNDSRIRLYDLKDHSLYCKYKGGQNSSSQIKAMFSHDGQYIISGSEDHFVYIWRTYHDVQNVRKDRNEYYESFSAHDAVVTAGIFAPVPSVIVPPSDGFERVDSELTYRSEIIVTADWSGGIKLFVNR